MNGRNWESRTVGELVTFSGGSQPPRSTFESTSRDGYVRLIQIRDYKTSDYLTYIPQELARKFCRKDDVMIGRYGPPIFQILRGLEGAYNVALIKAIPNNDVTKDYLYYFLQQEPLFVMIDRLSRRSAGQSGVDLDALREYEFPLPSTDEQKEITDLLDSVCDTINRFSKLVALVEERKLGLMQQLLSGKTRFKEFKGEKWRSYRLGELFTERVEIGRIDLPLVSITGQNGVVPRDSLSKRDSSSEDKSKYLRITPGDIGYNTMRMWQGVAGLSQIEGIVSPAYTICIPSKQIDAQFAAYLFKTAPMIHAFHRNSQGLVDDTLSLKYHNFARIHVTIPDVPEQKRIAAALSTCDQEIELLIKQMDCLKDQRHALMHKLLTGEIRVKVSKEN